MVGREGGGRPQTFFYIFFIQNLPSLAEKIVLADLSEMLLGAEMINVLCYVDVRGVLFSK